MFLQMRKQYLPSGSSVSPDIASVTLEKEENAENAEEELLQGQKFVSSSIAGAR